MMRTLNLRTRQLSRILKVAFQEQWYTKKMLAKNRFWIFSSDDVTLHWAIWKQKKKRKEEDIWKWNKRFKRPAWKKCSLAEEVIVNINLKNLSGFHWNNWFRGDTLFDKNRIKKVCWTGWKGVPNDNWCFGCINILMEINLPINLQIIKDYFSLEERLGNPLVQKALMTRALFSEILQNMHFVDNLQNLLPRNSKQDNCGNSGLSLSTYWSILNFQCTSMDFPCTSSRIKFIRKDIPIKWGLKFWFGCAMCHVISHVLGKERENQVWSRWITEVWTTPVVMHILVLFITSLTLMAELLENGFDKIDSKP